MIDLNLKGRKALVTGASLGIGAAIGKELADMGAEVFCCARDSISLDELCSHSENITGITADLGNKEATEVFLSEVKKLTGGVDIVINNVGASPSRNFLYMEDEDWGRFASIESYVGSEVHKGVSALHAKAKVGESNYDCLFGCEISQRSFDRLWCDKSGSNLF